MNPKRKKQVKEASDVHEIKIKKDYAGLETTPYLDWKDEKQLGIEPITANPDTLAETDGLFYQPKIDDPRIDLVKEMWSDFTPLQQQILQMVGYEGRSLDNCAIKLGLKKSTVAAVLKRLKVQIKKCSTKRGLQGTKVEEAPLKLGTNGETVQKLNLKKASHFQNQDLLC